MTTTTRTRGHSARAAVVPDRSRRRAAAIIRSIGQRRHCPGSSAQFVCARCHVAWTGAEADCWSCGHPATSEHSHRGAALLRLLNPVRPATSRKAARR